MTGLIAGQQLSLSLNNAIVITVTANGPFSFPVYSTYYGNSYGVVVATQPSGEICTVGNYTGIVTQNVANVTVVCSANNYTVGGTVSGLNSGGQFTLQNNGSNTLPVTSNGSFQFTTPIAFNSSYNVTVGAQPTGQTCTVMNGSGAAIVSNVTNVSVVCAANTFTIGGTLSGLGASDQVTLLDNGGNSLTLTANGPYAFTTPVALNSGYNVTVGTQPVGQMCSVSNGNGLATVANITNVNVLCSTDTYTIGGAVSGLGTGLQVTLDDNGADPNTVTSNTHFTFATPIAYGGQYNVTVGTQPTGQTCTVSNASATGVTANVTNVGVLCAQNTYTIGGTVSGLSGNGLVLKNNAGDPISVLSGSTSFQFDQPIAYGSGYNVTVFQQPTNEACNITNASGSNVMANVTNVQVGCSVNVPTVTSMSPTSGPTAGGTNVTITGTNFVSGATTVTIGGTTIPAASVTVNSATSLTFSTPAHAAGNVAVTVTTAGGTSSAVSGGFTYDAAPTLSSLSPAFGPTAGGTSVTVTGTNFVAGNTSVTIGGTTIPAASVTVNSATSLTFSTPAASASNVSVTVTTPGGTSSAVSGGFTYDAVPALSSLSPAFGPTAGGTSVTVTGTNFVAGNTSVIIGGTTIPAASVTVNSATSLTFSTPAASASNVSVTVTTPGGTSSPVPGGFSYQAFTVGGTLAGLASSQSVVLQNNGGNNLTLNTNGPFTFTSTFTQGSNYNVTVLTQPATQTCTVTNGSGVFGASNVTNVVVSCVTNTTTMSTSVSSLALSVTGLTEYGISGTPSSGAARTITLTNTGSYPAINLSIGYPTWPSGTSASSTCGSTLAAAGTCTISITPGATASSDGTHPCTATGTSPVPQTVTISASNASNISTSVVVLGYGCVYQDGYVFAFDDTTSDAGNVGGKVATTSDQSSGSGILWSSNGAGGGANNLIYGISDTSTTSSPNPSSGHVSVQAACNGNKDGACDTNNIYVYYQTTAPNAPVSTSSYAAGVCKATISVSGYSDWYLPAVCEMGYGSSASCGSSSSPSLQNMQSNLVDFNSLGLLGGFYWSSTELSSNPIGGAWIQIFGGSGSSSQTSEIKIDRLAARCVRVTN